MKTTLTKNRMTRQRRVILEELQKQKNHPTAEQLYFIVKKRLPDISLGTVYRNLDLLAKKRAIRKLNISGKQAQFDGNMKPHHHVRCIRCGRVEDICGLQEPEIEETAAKLTDYEISGHKLEFYGICPACIKKARSGKLKNRKNKKEND